MTARKDPLLFSRITYAAMILAAAGLLATLFYGLSDPSLRRFSEFVLGWLIIAIIAFCARISQIDNAELDRILTTNDFGR